MSFRTRLATFFILIVVVPMAAVGFLVFSLIDQSQTGKTDARAASSDGDKDDLIAAADNALYVAKHEGKNRTVRADVQTTNVSAGE